jgi:hypothetical protein
MLSIRPALVLFVCAVILLSPDTASCQQVKQRYYFSSVNEVGLLTGSKGEAVTVQTTNGFKKGKSFAGVGVGLDFYGYRTIPLFLSYRHDFSTKKNVPFAYANAGVNFLWLNFIEREQMQQLSSSPGFLYDVGVGWRLLGKNNRAFIASAGYTLKKVNYKREAFFIAPTPQLQSESFERYDYFYRRLVVKIGFQL